MFRYKTKPLIYAAILLGAFVLIFARPAFLTPLKFFCIRAVSLPLRMVSAPLREIKKIIFYHRTFDEYIKLKGEVDVLQGRLLGMEELLRENSRLERLLDFKRRMVYASVSAAIIARDPSKWDASLVIDRGEEDGVSVGMPVVSASGVAGKIFEVSAHTAKVILLTDPDFSVAALVQRSRETTLVSGTLQGLARLRYLPAEADVEVGDEVITSSMSPSFPEGLLIGEVVSVRHDPNSGTLDCLVQPAVRFSQVEEVLVIQKSPDGP